MSDKEVITQQARKIHALQKERDRLKKSIDTAIRKLTCVGGPLNDNQNQYDENQIKELQQVLFVLEQ